MCKGDLKIIKDDFCIVTVAQRAQELGAVWTDRMLASGTCWCELRGQSFKTWSGCSQTDKVTGVKLQACYFHSEFVLILYGCELKIA